MCESGPCPTRRAVRSPEPTARRPCLSAPAVHLKNSFSSLSPAASACSGAARPAGGAWLCALLGLARCPWLSDGGPGRRVLCGPVAAAPAARRRRPSKPHPPHRSQPRVAVAPPAPRGLLVREAQSLEVRPLPAPQDPPGRARSGQSPAFWRPRLRFPRS